MAERKSQTKARQHSKNGAPAPSAKPKLPVQLQVKLRPIFPPEQRAVFANHMIAQGDGHNIHLSFFDVRPPVLADGFTPPPDGMELDAECAVRIVIAQDRGIAFLTALATVLGVPNSLPEESDRKQDA